MSIPNVGGPHRSRVKESGLWQECRRFPGGGHKLYCIINVLFCVAYVFSLVWYVITQGYVPMIRWNWILRKIQYIVITVTALMGDDRHAHPVGHAP